MIVSFEREEDKEAAKDILSILEMAVNSYQRTRNEKLLTHIEGLSNWYDIMVEKIRSGDYTEADAQRARVDKILQATHADKN